MKIVFILFFLIPVSFLFGQEKDIPGMIKINDTLYIDKYEVTNKDWHEYLYWIELKFGKKSYNYKSALPDTTVWLDLKKNGVFYSEYYFRHRDFKMFPVVGINIEQAKQYCLWRLERIQEISTDTVYYIIKLPNINEWELAAAGGLDVEKYPFGYKSIKTKKNELKFLVRENFILNDYQRRFEIENYYGIPNKYGCINLIGNVAEMVMEKNISKGGSWFHSIEEAEILKNILYDSPKFWLGFRCVAVISDE
jgi:formylglycine-generating enzyme required for sulfatase activity